MLDIEKIVKAARESIVTDVEAIIDEIEEKSIEYMVKEENIHEVTSKLSGRTSFEEMKEEIIEKYSK